MVPTIASLPSEDPEECRQCRAVRIATQREHYREQQFVIELGPANDLDLRVITSVVIAGISVMVRAPGTAKNCDDTGSTPKLRVVPGAGSSI